MELVTRVNKLNNIAKLCFDFQLKKRVQKLPNREVASWVRTRLASMGPTFIKIGQFVSTRSDVFGEEFTAELKQLQDNVPSIPFQDIKSTLSAFESKFEFINEDPIASASIGQVHLGRLLNGEDVVVKIKRPNIDSQIKEDFGMLLFFIKFLKMFSTDRTLTEFEILFTEYYNLLHEEIDFKREISNMQAFFKMFARSNNYIKVPRVYPELCDNDVITMEYVPTIKIDDIAVLKELKFNRELMAQKLIEAYVTQIIEYGYVHIDPHPGNLGITRGGKLVFYDYGMILNLDNKIKENFNSLLVAIYDKDIDVIADIAMDMGLIVIEDKNVPYFKFFLLSFLDYIEKLDIENFKISYIDKVDQANMPFLISSKFLLLLRGLSILEGICKKLDPGFNYKKTLDPYISEYLVDMTYIENRAIADIDIIKNVPERMRTNKVKIEILEKNYAQLEKSIMRKNNQKHYFVVGLVVSLAVEHELGFGAFSGLLFTTIFYMYLK